MENASTPSVRTQLILFVAGWLIALAGTFTVLHLWVPSPFGEASALLPLDLEAWMFAAWVLPAALCIATSWKALRGPATLQLPLLFALVPLLATLGRALADQLELSDTVQSGLLNPLDVTQLGLRSLYEDGLARFGGLAVAAALLVGLLLVRVASRRPEPASGLAGGLAIAILLGAALVSEVRTLTLHHSALIEQADRRFAGESAAQVALESAGRLLPQLPTPDELPVGLVAVVIAVIGLAAALSRGAGRRALLPAALLLALAGGLTLRWYEGAARGEVIAALQKNQQSVQANPAEVAAEVP